MSAMREFDVHLTIRTILRPRFSAIQRVGAPRFAQAMAFIRGLYGPRLLEIVEVVEAPKMDGANIASPPARAQGP
jgi:hypothetical protein